MTALERLGRWCAAHGWPVVLGESPPGGPLPSLEHDLGLVEWLQCSHELSAGTTGYLCDALLRHRQPT